MANGGGGGTTPYDGAYAAATAGDLSPRRASFSDDGAPPWELIDALLGGGSGGAEPAWQAGDAAGLTATALPPPPPVGAVFHSVAPAAGAGGARCEPGANSGGASASGLRCLDTSHTHATASGGPVCGCLAPPSAAELPFFSLSSPRRCGESGEKRLRRLLIASPEWHSQAERLKLADRVEAEGKQALADVLRGGRCSALRKGTMADLCRYWGYRCDVFRSLSAQAPEGDEAESDEEKPLAPRHVRRRTAPPAAAAPAVLEQQRAPTVMPPLAMRGAEAWLQGCPLAGSVLASPASVAAAPSAAVEALRATIARVVMPLLRCALQRHAGAETVPELIRDSRGLLNQHMADRLADNELCIRMMQQDVAVRCNRVGKAQAAAGAARSQPQQGGAFFPPPPPASEFTPAWAMLRGSETMLLDSLRTVGGMMGRGLSLQDGLQARLAAAAPLTPAQRAWFTDLTAYSEAALCAFAHLEGAAAALQLAPWPQYLEAVVVTEETLHQFSAGVLSGLHRRREWMLAAAAQGAVAEGPSPAPMPGLREYMLAMPAR